MVRLGAALGLGLASVLVASAVIGQTPRNDGRFQRPDDAAVPAAAAPAPEQSASGDLDMLIDRLESLEATVVRLDDLAEGQTALGIRIAALQNAVDGLAAAVNRPDVDLAPVLADLGAIRRMQAELAAQLAGLALSGPAPLPEIDLTDIEAELAALRGELEAAITRHDQTITEAVAGVRALHEALLTELGRLTTPAVPAPVPPVNAGLSANGDNDAGEPTPAGVVSVRGFGEELVLRLYGMVAGLRREFAGE